MDVLVTAISLSAVYALVALGISLTWAGLGFLNLAQGFTFAACGYAAWFAAEHLSGSVVVLLLAGALAGAAIGALLAVLVYLPLEGKPNWDVRTMIATLAVAFIGGNLLLEIFGPRTKSIPDLFGGGAVELLGSVVTAERLGMIATGAVVVAATVLLMTRTRLGLGVRALTQDREGAAMVGINRRAAAFLVLGVSGALAGIAAVLLSGIFFVSPDAGFIPLIKGLLVALLGGLGSVRGTVIAAVLVGGCEALTAQYLGGEYVLVTLFALIAVVLLIRPRGIAGVLEVARA